MLASRRGQAYRQCVGLRGVGRPGAPGGGGR